MDWLDTKIAEFSQAYKKHGFFVEAFPKCNFDPVGNSHDLSHFIHLRAQKSERHLLHFLDLEDEIFKINRKKEFKNTISSRINYKARKLRTEAREYLETEALPDTPDAAKVVSTRNGHAGKRFEKELLEAAQHVVKGRWYESTVSALERQLHLVEAVLPRIVAIDKHDFYLKLAEKEPAPPKLTRRSLHEHYERSAERIEQSDPQRYSSKLHVFTYNGVAQIVQDGFARMLNSTRAQFTLYWNDQEVSHTPRSVAFGERWHLNGVKTT